MSARRPLERAPRPGPPLRTARASCDGGVDESDRLVGAAAQLEVPAHDLTGATVDRGVQIRPAVLGDPDAGHVEVPELIGPLDPEEARPAPPAKRPVTLQQPLLP